MITALILACAFAAVGIAGAITAGVTGKQQADALEKQADEQYQANEEARATQVAENEKAYQRNSSLGQKAQLMAAGLSEQQAMQVIAGNGATGEYQPAEISSLMDGVDFSAAERAMAQANNAAGQTFLDSAKGITSMATDLLTTSLAAPDGGALGAMDSGDLQKFVCENLDKLPASARGSYSGFLKWYNSDNGAEYRSPAVDKAIKSAESSMFGRKALNSFFGQSSDLLSGEEKFAARLKDIDLKNSGIAVNATVQALNNAHTAQLNDLVTLQGVQRDEMIQRMQTQMAQYNLINEQILGERYDNTLKALGVKREEMLFDVITDAQKATMLETASEAYRNWLLYDDEDYITTWVQEQYMTEEGKLALAQLEATENQDALNKYARDPVAAWITQLHTLFKGSLSGGVASAGASAGGFAVLLKALRALPK